MQNTAIEGIAPRARGQNETCQSVVSGLAGLIEHVQAILRQTNRQWFGKRHSATRETAVRIGWRAAYHDRPIQITCADRDWRVCCHDAAADADRHLCTVPGRGLARRARWPQLIVSSFFEDPPERFLVGLPLRK
jgi:hypothetical protein